LVPVFVTDQLGRPAPFSTAATVIGAADCPRAAPAKAIASVINGGMRVIGISPSVDPELQIFLVVCVVLLVPRRVRGVVGRAAARAGTGAERHIRGIDCPVEGALHSDPRSSMGFSAQYSHVPEYVAPELLLQLQST
jgi:hypothetical protein